MKTLAAGHSQNQTLQTAPHKKQQSMPRPKGSKNKVTADVKEQFQNILEEPISFIGVNSSLDQNSYPLWGTCPGD